MASKETPEAAAVSKAEQPSAPEESTEKTMTTTTSNVIMPPSDQVHLREINERKKFSNTPRIRLVLKSTSISSNSMLYLSSGENDQRRHPPPPAPVVPDWVMALASRCQEEHEGAVTARPEFLMTKRITKTDLHSDNNSLRIPSASGAFVTSNIIPLLRDDVKKAARLGDYPKKKRKRDPESAPAPPEVEEEGQDLQQLPSKRRKARRGLQVTAWTRSRWHFNALWVTCKHRNKRTVRLKGEHLKYLYDRSFLREGDQVELWGFRDVRGQLHLALHKSSSSH